MKKKLIRIAAAAMCMAMAASNIAFAAEVPEDRARAAPESAEDLLEGDISGGTSIAQGIADILAALSGQVKDVIRERTKGAAAMRPL